MQYCRSCNNLLELELIDLGTSAVANDYLSALDLKKPEPWIPLKVLVCENCWLSQTEDFLSGNEVFRSDYAYLSSTSSSWLQHAKQYSEKMIDELKLNENSFVIEVASNDGYLLKNFNKRNIPCLGIEPTAGTAKIARDLGIETEEIFLDEHSAKLILRKFKPANLVIANNVLAHVPDVNSFVSGLRLILHNDGVLTLEFPCVTSILNQNQFDTIYHEHFSYFSATAARYILEKHGLVIFDIENLATHGGSLRIYVKHEDSNVFPISESVEKQILSEIASGIQDPNKYLKVSSNALKVKHDLLRFLLDSKSEGKTVIGYGAAAKGNTLLNFAGVKPDLIQYIVDRSKYKIGKFAPGSRIPIKDDTQISKTRPDYILVFPWNIMSEIQTQLEYTKEWGCKLVTAIPNVKIWD